MDGFGLVQEIRRRPEVYPVTVVMLTSAGHSGDAEHCRELGIHSYLYKPVRKQELLASDFAGARVIRRHPLPSAAMPAARPARATSLHILLAEDNRTNQTVATRMLQKMGHTVPSPANGKEALLCLRRMVLI